MAKKSKMAKSRRLKAKFLRSLSLGNKPKHPTKVFNMCDVCGRVRGYLRKFDMCRICVREKANAGELPGVRKSSW